MLKEISLTNYSTINNAIITLTDTESSGKGKHFVSRFLQPGLAGYPGQYGNALIRKENLDKFIYTMKNKPVVINHQSDITDDDKVGEVMNVWFNPKDGWYWCDGVIWDETAQNLITDKEWSVSCSYNYTKYNDEGGTENNIPYDIEFLDGEFTHLAIVDNPRYTGANIVINSNVNNWNETDHPRDEQGKFREKGGNVKSFYEKEYKDALKEISEGKDYAQINYNTTIQQMKSALEFLKKHDSDWDKYDVDENIKEYEDLSDDWNKEQIKRIAREKAAQDTLKKWIREGKDRKNEYYKIYEPHRYKKEEEKQVNNSNRKDNLIMAVMDELKKLISNVENDKGASMDEGKKVNNKDVDKRELLREADAIAMKPVSDFKGGEEEKFRTLTKLMEEIGYNKSSRGTADNEVKSDEEGKEKKDEKKADELKKDVKEDVENKCKDKVDNSKPSFFDRLNEVYNSAIDAPVETGYVSREEQLNLAKEYFS